MIDTLRRFALALALLAPCAVAQDPPPPPIPTAKPAPPIVDATGAPLVPGVLPGDTSAPARAAWERVRAASVAPGATRKPVTAFDLELDIVYKASEAQTNEIASSRYRYSAPGWVRLTTGKGRELLRGPSGDWLLDPGRKEKTRLEVGRENEVDKKQLDDTLGIARNFLALTDPSALRIASLRAVGKPPIALPEAVASSATGLEWLELRTPDFRPADVRASSAAKAADSASIARVQLGVDPKTALVALAIVDQDEARAGLHGTTLLLALDTYVAIDGYRVPRHIRVFEVAQGASGFRAEPSSDIWLIAERSRLATELPADVFAP